jgi:arabinan endo-1,5-alpha-L-arabinosidase
MLRLRNPLIDADCPDPCVVATDQGWLLVGTTFFDDVPDKFPLWSSPDLVHWCAAGHVFPAGRTPLWAIGQFWAPEIHRTPQGWLCYFTARDTRGRLCIGVASASDPLGPWQDRGAPILYGQDVGVIDAHRFVDDDGRAYLFWKVDGNDLVPQGPTPIHVQELTASGTELVGTPTIAITNDLAWEAHVVEGPWAVRRGGYIYVFYSGNAFHSPEYRTGVARARDIRGPYEKRATPLLSNGPRWRGPGHGCLIAAYGQDFFVYHAWDREAVFGRHPRLPLIGRVHWHDGWPTIEPVPDRAH